MRFSVESRVPFLNKQLANYTEKLPFDYLVNNRSVTKFIMREAFRDLLPPKIYTRVDKIGFEAGADFLSVYAEQLRKIIDGCSPCALIDKKQLTDKLRSVNDLSSGERGLLWREINLVIWADVYNVSL